MPEASDVVAGEFIVLLSPGPDSGQARPEMIGDDVLGRTDKDPPVPDPRVPGDLLDHVSVVIGGQSLLRPAAVWHGQPAHKVGEPDVRRALLIGILMQVVVELPGFVANPQVVLVLLGNVTEHHEIGQQYLVHPAPGLEAMQVVVGTLPLKMTGLTGELD